MEYRNHLVFATASWVAVGTAMGLPVAAVAGGLLVATPSGLLPDIDTPNSWLGRRLPGVSHAIGAVFGHRGITHSALAIIGCLAALAWLASRPGLSLVHVAATPLVVGYLSHLVADMTNPSGVPLFWPSRRRVRLPLTWRCGGPLEAIVAWGALAGAVYYAARPLFG